MSQKTLAQVLRNLPHVPDPKLLVGSATGDDAGIYQIDHDRALVQTVDFFTPIVDDARAYGQIAATNSLSDVYAMGGRPLTAMNIMGIPTDLVPPKVIHSILRGGLSKVHEAGCAMVGGHTIQNPEPVYGLSVTGIVSPRFMLTNASARPGDLLILTKPIGTGVITTGIKRGLTSPALAKRAIRFMCTLNRAGAKVAESGLVRCGTDITGFGLTGHLGSMCRASGVGIEIHAERIPIIGPEVLNLIEQDCIPGGSRANLDLANNFVDWGKTKKTQKFLLADAQTSGGLLLCVPPKYLSKVQKILIHERTPCAVVIGRVIKSSKPRIWIKP